MDRFRVWVHAPEPVDEYAFIISVDGIVNARWLVGQLARSFVFGSADQIRQARDSTLCSLRVPRTALLSFHQLQKILSAIPEVTLLNVARDQ